MVPKSLNLRNLLTTSGLVYLDVDKQHRFVFGGSLLQDALLLPHNTHESVVGLEREGEESEECVMTV